MTIVLVADAVSRYFGTRQVLAAATLRAVAGEVRVLLGRNGTGKSTLMKIACGLVTPHAGVVHLNGKPLLRVTLPQLARQGVFYLPDRRFLRLDLTVGGHIELFAERYRLDLAGAIQRSDAEDLLDRFVDELSPGDLRRAEIAVAAARSPACLLADEPFRNLSPREAETVSRQLKAIAARGAAVVVSGHEVRLLLDVADHVTWCTAGTTYELGPPAAAQQYGPFVREYLGPLAR